MEQKTFFIFKEVIMKKLLLLTLALASFQISQGAVESSQTDTKIADDVIGFKKMEKGHKAAWLIFVQSKQDKKYDLLIKHSNEWFDFGINKLNKVKNLTSFAELGTLLRTELTDAISLHRKQREDWKSLCEQEYKAGLDLYNKQEAELQKFEQSVGLLPEEKEKVVTKKAVL
jgi:hypothetical protein